MNMNQKDKSTFTPPIFAILKEKVSLDEVPLYVIIQSDYYRYRGEIGNWIKFLGLAMKDHAFAYSLCLRLSSRNNFLYIPAKIGHKLLGTLYHIMINPKTKIGYGLRIGHGIGIIINSNTIIGNNCNLGQFLNIGSQNGTPAVIGDNVYLGPFVSLVEDVKIGDNVTIGAGAVVTKSIPENATAAGVPAKVLNFDNPGRFSYRNVEP